MSIYFTVYRTTNLINGNAYIGVHKTVDPWDDYLGSGPLILRAIQKYGKSNFTKEVLAVFDNPEDMWATEARLVNEAWISRADTYNIQGGGFGCSIMAQATKEKLRIASTGFQKTPEAIEKHRQRMKGRSKSDAHKIALRESKKAHWTDPVKRANMIASKVGKKRSPESRERMRQAALAYQARKRSKA